MLDRRAAKEAFRTAVQKLSYQGDPYALAKILRIPPVNNQVAAAANSKPSSKESLQENGTDWSAVLNAWLEACEAADGVR